VIFFDEKTSYLVKNIFGRNDFKSRFFCLTRIKILLFDRKKRLYKQFGQAVFVCQQHIFCFYR